MAGNKNIEVGGRLHSIATGNVLAGANEIFDDEKNKKQSEINTETYTLVNEVNAKLDGLSPEQQGALDVATKANKNEANLGYYVCSTEENVAAKVISDATGYILSKGGSMKVKMTNTNTAANATLNINSTGAKPLYYDGERASANNSWEAGETIEVYYDGTSYYANNVASGSSDGVFDVSKKYPTSGVEGGNTYTLEGALLVLNTNLPSNKKKGGMSIKFIQSSDNKYVQYFLTKNEWSLSIIDWDKINSTVAEAGLGGEPFDLDIDDEEGNVLMRLKDGHIKTKNFDSAKSPSEYNTNKSDLDITDEQGNVLMRLKDGHIFTKNFNSMSGGGSSAEGGQWNNKIWYAYGTSLTQNTVQGRGHYTDVVALLSNLQQTNKGIGGGGITNFSNKSVYNAVINPDDGKVNADIITLEVGANDAAAPIGTIYDETTDTFCGALNLCIRALQTLTKAQIVVISSTNAAYNTSTSSYATPSTQYGPDNHTKYDQWKATEEVCKINSIYYVPMGEDGGLGYARLRQDYDGEHLYIEDAIHHTPLGAMVLGEFVWNKIKMIPIFNK